MAKLLNKTTTKKVACFKRF